MARGQRQPAAPLAKSKGCSCKLPEKPWQLRQSLSRSEAQLLCSQRIFLNFPATGQLVVWQEKKVHLMDRISG